MSLRAARLSSYRRLFAFTPARTASTLLDPQTISTITSKEREITGQDQPVADGPTAQAQKHAGQTLTAEIVAAIAQAEAKLTGQSGPAKQGPAAFVQRQLTRDLGQGASNDTAASSGGDTSTGVLDSNTISKITAAEKEITGSDEPVKGGPTAQAQKHTGEPIGSDNLHDITEGEKKITGGERVKGGPTATAQSELSKSQS